MPQGVHVGHSNRVFHKIDWAVRKELQLWLRRLTKRLVEALDMNGAPLPNESKAALDRLKDEADDARVTTTVQKLLDPLCVAAVEIAPDGTIKAVSGRAVEVEENGWRTVLVKVLNRAGVQSRLRVDSPNARPIPHGPLPSTKVTFQVAVADGLRLAHSWSS